MLKKIATHPLVHMTALVFGLAAASPYIAPALQFLVRYPQ